MKLHRMELAGVGSFADSMEIDFGALSHAGLFLIEGPTGSGKSTILDALVFALYGSVAGASSDAGRLDSHMRTDSPFVELDFEVAGTVHRVRRSPAHLRTKKRGGGTTSANATASLLRLDPDGPVELATRASDVSSQVQAIIGLDKDQFVSTVVLAQGEFASFLDARTEDRRVILERVFGTEFYKRVEDQLYTMRREARETCRVARDRVDQMVHECCGILDLDPGANDPIAQIDAALGVLGADLQAATAQAVAADERLQVAAAALEDATRRAADQVRKREKLAVRSRLQMQATQVAAWRETLGAHQRAQPLVAVVGDWREACARAESARTALTQALDVLHAAGESDQAGPQRLQEVVTEIGRLEAPAAVETSLPERRAEVALLLEAAQRATSDAEHATCARDDAQTHWQQVVAELARIPDHTAQRLELQSQEQTLRHRAERVSKAQAKRRQLAVALADLEGAEADHQVALERLRAGEEDLQRDQAVALAARLEPGQPCLVCGSREHPVPAVGSRAEVDLHDLRADEQRCRVAVTPLRDAVSALQGGLAEYADEDAGPEEIAARLEAVTAELAELADLQEQRAGLQARVDELVARRSAAVDAAAVAVLLEQEARTCWAAAAEALAAAEAEVAAARGDFASVAQGLASLAAIQMAWQAEQACRSGLDMHSRVRDQARKALDRALDVAGFRDVCDVEQFLLPDAEVAHLTDEIASWDDQTAEVDAALRELAGVDLEERIDVPACEVTHGNARTAANAARDEAARLADRWGLLQPRREQLSSRVAHLETVRAQTDAVIRMADLATASRSEVIHKIKLSSFVLMRRFEDVVNAANDRLDAISEGRYQLKVETHGLDARSQAGLDLLVYDGRSDTFRSTRSLSGGERFYVSLALALGLADVVRSESGGIELGTLFIDEGFGSLDGEVLEEVMDMLEQVRVGEDRVIGLISHVEVLKQRIDPRISVRRDPERPGVSTLEVHV